MKLFRVTPGPINVNYYWELLGQNVYCPVGH